MLKLSDRPLTEGQGPKRLLSLRSVATASSARPTGPAAAATAHDRLDLAVVGIRRRDSCAIGRRGRRARCAEDTESGRKNDGHKDCSHLSTPFFSAEKFDRGLDYENCRRPARAPRPSSAFCSK